MRIPTAIRCAAASLAGRQAAAIGASNEPSFAEGSSEAVAWANAYDAATAHQRAGLDVLGHPPGIPKLCARDVRAVCNCCDRCRKSCTVPKYPPGLVTRILRKVLL